MWNNGHDTYLESKVLSADPVELVNMLYETCSVAVREARYHLADGRIAERSREINRAYEILAELTLSLDHERGGEISQRLALLYDYMQRRLLDANMEQAEAPLAEVLGLLSTLSEAWAGVRAPAAIAAMEAPAEWAPAPNQEAKAASPYAQPESPYVEAPSPWAQAVSAYAEGPSPWADAPSPWAQAPIDEVAASRSHAWSL